MLGTDWFVDPQRSAEPKLNAPALLGGSSGDFLLSARVTVDFAGTYDAGVLVVYESDDVWAKLCFEYSPQREPMVVSVVTRGVSDDCNSFVVDDESVWLRIARVGPAYAFHASTDGSNWSFIRHFALQGADAAVDRVRRSIADGRRLFSHLRADCLRGCAARRPAKRPVEISRVTA